MKILLCTKNVCYAWMCVRFAAIEYKMHVIMILSYLSDTATITFYILYFLHFFCLFYPFSSMPCNILVCPSPQLFLYNYWNYYMEFVKRLFTVTQGVNDQSTFYSNYFQKAINTFTQKRLNFNGDSKGKFRRFREICKMVWLQFSEIIWILTCL